jgi:hypothetical protein
MCLPGPWRRAESEREVCRLLRCLSKGIPELVATQLHGAEAPHRAVMGFKRLPVASPRVSQHIAPHVTDYRAPRGSPWRDRFDTLINGTSPCSASMVRRPVVDDDAF